MPSNPPPTIPASMRAVWYERTGDPHTVLVLGEIETPRPGPNEVLIRVMASGINPHDTKKRAGWLGMAMAAARVVPHSDTAGIVAAVGPGVPEARIGQRVWAMRADRPFPGAGAAAEFARIPADLAFPLPDDTPFEIGAALGVPGMTAHRAIFADGPVTGKTVLVTGGAGAVASYAIQFARWNGARVLATISSDEKAEHARRMGADQTIDYRRQDVAEEVGRLTGGAGVDRIVEVDFGANIDTCHAVIKPNGAIAAYSSTREPRPTLPYYAFAMRGVTLHFVQGMLLTPAMSDRAARDIGALLRRGLLQHPIARTYPLAQTADAHAFLEAGQAIGKVVVTSP